MTTPPDNQVAEEDDDICAAEGDTLTISVQESGARLDAYLAAQVPDMSRARIQQLLKAGEVRVDGVAAKPSYHVATGDRIILHLPAPTPPVGLAPEDIPLDILYQDEDLLVLNKPAGLVVHPGAGNWTGTLVHALLYHVRDLSGIGGELRPGIVHRLDKETSGLMVVAKHDVAHRTLAAMIERRAVSREYQTLAWGEITREAFTVDAPIGRHPTERQRMAVLAGEEVRGTRRHAVTHFTRCEHLHQATALTAKLDTGRTHQIRVHLHYLGHPVVGDPVYGVRSARRYLALISPAARAAIAGLPGQALHAFRLSFPHPRTGAPLVFTAPPPPAYLRAWEALREG
ncbi:MAG TPA: RluA family pseudouridine synthase [Armatimonadota bacterium]|jgi:23S rRNA pseudouridine1911/1915/1917 synthase